jgi:hypothetical protein
MKKDSTPAPRPRKDPQPKKPRPDFPLSIHKGTGCWCKKVKGRVHYFGKVSDDPKGIASGFWNGGTHTMARWFLTIRFRMNTKTLSIAIDEGFA